MIEMSSPEYHARWATYWCNVERAAKETFAASVWQGEVPTPLQPKWAEYVVLLGSEAERRLAGRTVDRIAFDAAFGERLRGDNWLLPLCLRASVAAALQ